MCGSFLTLATKWRAKVTEVSVVHLCRHERGGVAALTAGHPAAERGQAAAARQQHHQQQQHPGVAGQGRGRGEGQLDGHKHGGQVTGDL